MKKFLLLPFMICFVSWTYAYDLKQINDKRYMTNSCILSLSQDPLGRVWIGTCDGINLYDGHEITVFNIKDKENYLSGNLIDNMLIADNYTCLIQTYFGLNLIDLKKNTIYKYSQYKLAYGITQSKEGIFLFLCGLKGSNKLIFFHCASKTFKSVPIHWIEKDELLTSFVDNYNVLWLVTPNKIYNYKLRVNKDGNISLGREHAVNFSHNPLIYCTYDDGYVHYVDNQNNFYSYEISKKKHHFVRNLKDLSSRGYISSILFHHGDYFIGYLRNGVVVLKKQNSGYSVQSLPINVGVFCMVKDRYQDVIWIGSDGQGVYLYSNAQYVIRSVISRQLGIGTPVRSLFWDEMRTLWIGTKGNGIVKIYNYSPDKDIDKSRIEHITFENHPDLVNDDIYDIVKSRQRPLLWIATDRGISYYSYYDRNYHYLPISVDGKEVHDIHKIYETSHSELWFVSGLNGVFRAKITGDPAHPLLKNIRHYYINHGEQTFNSFFSIYARSDSLLFFANKAGGTYTFDFVHNKLVRMSHNYNETFLYVTTINYDHRGHYLWGTNHGLVKFGSDRQYKIFSSPGSLINGTIHGIIYNAPDDIWFSTNMGLEHYDAIRDLFHAFGYNTLSVVEFSDGAAFKDPKTGLVFFGGVNGFVCIKPTGYKSVAYMPNLHVVRLTIFGEDVNPFVYVSGSYLHHKICLKHNQNFFNITFNAMDYINGSNYVFYYRLKKDSGKWINNGQNNTISFNNVTSGHYKLEVKYYNTAIDRESKIYVLDIYIAYPWYNTVWAYLIYILICFLIVYYFADNYIKRKRYSKEKEMKDLQIRHEKEVSESKLNFFTTVAQEFSTPLTLISGSCERILSITELSKIVVNYAHLIEANAVRLNDLIRELVEFRSIEIGSRKPNIRTVFISQLVENVVRSYVELATSKDIIYQSKISQDVTWNTDKIFFSTIIANLIASTFHYTGNGGSIKVELKIDIATNNLIFKVASSKNNISKDELLKLFSQNGILNNFENHTANGFSRNRLGLALSQNMVKMLNGSIKLKEIEGRWLEILTTFPIITTHKTNNIPDIQSDYTLPLRKPENITLPRYEMNEMYPSMLIIENEISILWLIGDVFSSKFNIIPLRDMSKLDEVLSNDLPNLIIYDMSMPGTNGLDIIYKLKTEKETQHIPIIALSNKYETEEQIKALSAGVEMYITKPFNINMLQVSVFQIIKREESLRTYYNSAMSSFEKAEGHYIHKESKKFLRSVLKIIKDHISDVNLSPGLIAKELNISTRNFYRKMDEIGMKSPAEMIKDCRLNLAQQLLLTTKDTIAEIIFKSGFSNKVTFFKSFHGKYGCTPKEYRKKNDMGE